MPSPIPRDAPVTSATCPSTLNFSSIMVPHPAIASANIPQFAYAGRPELSAGLIPRPDLRQQPLADRPHGSKMVEAEVEQIGGTRRFPRQFKAGVEALVEQEL